MNIKDAHPSVQHIIKYFAYEHLSGKLQLVSKPFSDLANQLVFGSVGIGRLPQNRETTVALRKLLESKDCAVRAAVGEDEA